MSRLVTFSEFYKQANASARENDASPPPIPENLLKSFSQICGLITLANHLQNGPRRTRADRKKNIDNLVASLAEHKLCGAEQPETHPEIRKAYALACKQLWELSPPHYAALMIYDPRAAIQSLLDLTNDDPFHLAALEITERNELLQVFAKAGHYICNDTAYAQIFTNIEIGKYNPRENIEFLKTAAVLVATLITSNPANRSILKKATCKGTEQSNIDLFKMTLAVVHKLLGIWGPVNIILQDCADTPSAAYNFEAQTGIHIYTFYNIAAASAEFIVEAGTHEPVHAGQNEGEKRHDHKLPVDPTDIKTGLKLEKENGATTLGQVTISRQSKTSQLLIRSNRGTMCIDNSNLSLAIVGFGDEGTNKYKEIAPEREAYGFHNLVMSHIVRQTGKHRDAEMYRARSDAFFITDLNPNKPEPNTSRVRALISQLSFQLPT